LQRKCAACEAETKGLNADGAQGVSQGAEQRIQAMQHRSGRALSGNERAFFEPRFGADFSGVRVHEGRAADAAARSVSARAYTQGHHIVMRANAYQPGSTEGNRLMAHELTHVIQQGGGSGDAGNTLQRDTAGKEGSAITCSMTATRETLGTGFCISGRTNAPNGTTVSFHYIPGMESCGREDLASMPSFGTTVVALGRFYWRSTNVSTVIPGVGRQFGAVIGNTACCTSPSPGRC